MSVKKYFQELGRLLESVWVTDSKGSRLDLDGVIDSMVQEMACLQKAGGKIMFVGNGGSAGIAGHQAVDYWKNGNIRATAFNDASLLTCISNDYGYEHVFEKPVEMFAQPGDWLFAISSSGRSENILRAVRAAQENGCRVTTFSGFAPGNPLRTLGDVNFYVQSNSYGLVEIAHLALSHGILERWIEKSAAQQTTSEDFVRRVAPLPESKIH